MLENENNAKGFKCAVVLTQVSRLAFNVSS